MIRRALAFSLLQRYSELTIQVGSMIVLARLIPPAEFGVFVAGAAVLALASAVGDFGQRDYLIQERELTRERRAAALGLSWTASLACMLLVAGAAVLLPDGAVDHRLRTVLLILALGLLVQPLTAAITALLQRDMRFGPVCAIGTVQVATSSVAAIFTAALGFGAASLAWGALAGALAAFGVALRAGGPGGWTAPSLRGWRGVARFGVMRTAVAGLAQVGDAGAMLAISHLLGFAATGLLDRGRKMSKLFNQVVIEAVKPVVLPVLAKHERSGGDLKEAYLYKVSCLSALAWPFFAFIALFAEPIVGLVLGPTWSEVVSIVRVLCILCLAGIWGPPNQLNARFYIALGLLPALLRRQVVLQSAKLLLVAGCALVSVEAVAAAFVAASLLKVALDLGPLKRRLNYGIGELLGRVTTSAAVTAASLVPPLSLVAIFGMPRVDDLALLAAGAVAAACGWLVGTFATGHPLWDEITLAVRATRLRLRPDGRAAA